jgi:hypothetical protein
MFLEILFLALLFAVILVRVLISIKIATEHAVAHWNQVAVINEVTSGINKVTSNITSGVAVGQSGTEGALRRSARIQALNLKEPKVPL